MTLTDPTDRILVLAQTCLDEPDLSTEELAGRAFLSRFHFSRLVTATAGEPPGSLRRRILLERAAYRLLSGDQTILDIATEAGYASHEAFGRAFTRAYGTAPSALRRSGVTYRRLRLPAPSGVHFQPPGGLRLPATAKETDMTVLQQMVDNHVDSLTGLIEASAELGDEVLDRPIEFSVEAIDDDMTLRRVLNAMVTQEEHWINALRGEGWPDDQDASVSSLMRRHSVAGPEFRTVVANAIEGDELADTFIDTTCEPPDSYTLGGTVAHVLTFGAVRRTIAVGALWSAGVRRMELADPRPAIDRLAETNSGSMSSPPADPA